MVKAIKEMVKIMDSLLMDKWLRVEDNLWNYLFLNVFVDIKKAGNKLQQVCRA